MHRVFLDPGGKHCVATVVHPGGAETYYHHARWPRPKLLPRLRNVLVNAVAWNRQTITEGELILLHILFLDRIVSRFRQSVLCICS